MFAEIIYPVEAASAVRFNKRMVREDIEKEFAQVKKETIDSKRHAELEPLIETTRLKSIEIAHREQAAGREPSFEAVEELNKEFNKKRLEIEAKYEPETQRLFEECQERIAKELNRIERDYRSRRNVQYALAVNLARISPVSCYAYIVSGLADTGVAESENFVRNAQRFQDQVRQILYDKVYDRFGKFVVEQGFDYSDPPSFPDMKYRYHTLAESLQIHWPDFLVLCLFDVLFCALALTRFNRYDVR